MKQCYNCKSTLGFWKSGWVGCYMCGFPIECTNVLNNLDIRNKKRLFDSLASELNSSQRGKKE